MLELATTNDRPSINRLAQQVHEMHVSWRPDLYTMPQELFPEDLFHELVKNRELYVAKLDDTVVGFAWVRMRLSEGHGQITRKVMLLNQICVEETLRNRGIGTRMAEEIRILARAFGCTDLQLAVYPQNDEAVSFWQKCGYMIQSINMQRKV